MRRKKRLLFWCLLLLVLVSAVLLRGYYRPLWHPVYLRLVGMKTVDEAVGALGDEVPGRILPAFEAAGLAYPPSRVAFVILKEERQLELWGKGDGPWAHVRDYPILGASGTAGPKLREGDRQVPEGLYRITALHPNSLFHLSLKVGYPNAYDLQMAEAEGRDRLGGDIFIHGGQASIGCIAIGDRAIEDLFVLVARVGPEAVEVVIAPRDLRLTPSREVGPDGPTWRRELYENLREALRSFPPDGKPAT